MTARLSRVQHSGYEGVLGHAIVYFLGNSTIPNVNFIPENGVNPVISYSCLTTSCVPWTCVAGSNTSRR
jgi:hypothetical protein